jgi:hypothetical protein
MVHTMFKSSRAQSLTCIAVAALFLWLTTLDCLTCCVADQIASAARCAVTDSVAHPNCCEEAVEAAEALDRAPDEATGFEVTGTEALECALLATSYGDAESPRSPDFDQAPELEPAVVSAQITLSDSPRPARIPARVANRGDTYLRCCVLLI